MGDDGSDSNYIIRVRGLPWSCTEEEILKFFDPIEVKGGVDGIHLATKDGRFNGEALIEFDNAEDFAEAEKKHNKHIGRRYIEVFPANKNELDLLRQGENSSGDTDDSCVRLRGLPFHCSKEEIYQFFSGLDIVPNGIAMVTDFQGRTTGEAFVQFDTKAGAEKAQDRHKEKIGHRWELITLRIAITW
uniref:Heterogeneous nuclear ribonucleoprotein H-like n=1 Tax=Hirondellea gigas TaxID=1518452 RepID=A0A6A7G1A6_9CRUS